jgi:hypothetical protein
MHGAGPEFSQVSKPTFKSALPTNLIPKVEIVRCISERDLSDRRPSEIGDNNTRPQLPDTPSSMVAVDAWRSSCQRTIHRSLLFDIETRDLNRKLLRVAQGTPGEEE